MRRTGRSLFFHQLQRTFRAAMVQNSDSPRGVSKSAGMTRRQFMGGVGAGIGAAMLATYTRGARGALPSGPKVAVVGAGIAGLNATYLLAKAGFHVSLFEGSNHVGGRIQTGIGLVANGITTELGGEFIDSTHDDMLSLAQLFGLGLIDTFGPSEAGLDVAYFGGGRLRTEEEVIHAFKPLAKIVERDFNKTSDDITFDSFSKFDARLDNTDLETYFSQNIKTPWLYEMLEAAYVNEYGLELAEQSSLNFVWTIGTDTTDGFAIYGESDQRYKIRGGNQQVVDALGHEVADQLVLQHRLTALKQVANGTYQLTFDRPQGGSRTYGADIVVLCVPFTILRNVQMQVALPAVKKRAIQQLGYGTNAKLILGFSERTWRREGFTGDSYAGGLAYQSGWDASRQQGGNLGAYTIFPGGEEATDLEGGSAQDQAKRLLPGLNDVFPGVHKAWLGTAHRAYWPANPFVLGSYSCYKPGQYTGIRGAEGMPVGNLYFAGEHTSLDWQGYMNGGAATGRMVAEALIG